MIRVAICDDEAVMLSQMERIVQQTFADNGISCELFCFQSGTEMLTVHREHEFDIVFLDILMPDQNGFDVAKNIRTFSDKTLLLFVTSQDELVYDSFNYRPFYFLRKGDKHTFSQSLSEVVLKIVYFLKRNKYIPVKLNSGEVQMLFLQDILYISSNRNLLQYHLISGSYIPVREKLNDVESKLSPYSFIRIHKQYIVNMNKIQRLDTSREGSVTLLSGRTLPIGRKYRETALIQYKEFMRSII